MTNFVSNGCLSQREINILERDISKYENNVHDATIVNSKGSYKDENIRSCKVRGINFESYPSTLNILQSNMIENYKPIYPKLDYSKISELQYIQYVTGDFFRRHKDVINNGTDQRRVLTMSVNMSDPDEYEGGELVVYSKQSSEYVLDKTKGSFLIIPAFMEHEARKVTSGKRKVLICWLNNSFQLLNKFRSDFDLYTSAKLMLDK